MVSQWVGGIKPVPIERCVDIERVTEGSVTRRDLRPDDWHRIWPELAPGRAEGLNDCLPCAGLSIAPPRDARGSASRPGVAREPASRGLSPASVHLTALAADSPIAWAVTDGRRTKAASPSAASHRAWRRSSGWPSRSGATWCSATAAPREIAELRQRLQQLERAA